MKFNLDSKGTITAPFLLISTTLIIICYALLFLLVNQFNLSFRQTAYEQALYIAESGIQYYRWHLAHAPEDYTDGTGGNPGPYLHDYKDPQGEIVGTFSLEITPPEQGSSIVTIKSTGWMNSFPTAKRTVEASYGLPSLAQYSNLSNASSWYGSGITVNGLVHSNTGIRMDGINTSIVTSAQQTYTCGTETGCSPSRIKDGVWGSGPNHHLWQFPAPTIDFDSISFDFGIMRTAAQENGLYLGPSGNQGYSLVFNSNGTVTIYRVNSTSYYWGYSVEKGCERLYQNISNTSSVGTYNLTQTPIIFIEDNLWVRGVVNGKTTVVAARFPIDSNAMNIWIPNNITYSAKDGGDNLGLISQNNIYFARDIPENFEIDAALIAQKGTVLRHGYHLLLCGYSTQRLKDHLTIYGTLITNGKSYWNFGDPPTSGFIQREMTYDANLLYSPPPYFPTSGEYEFLSWQEK